MHPTDTATLTHPTTQPPEPDPTTTTPPQDAAQTWTLTTTEGLTFTGYQPAWSMDNPSGTDIPLDRALDYLRTYAHYTILPIEPLLPHTDIAGTRWTDWTFITQIECHPYSNQPHEHTPTANLAIIEDYEIGGLDPTTLAHIATQLRTQADLFEHEVRPALITARTDWASHHRPRIPDSNRPTTHAASQSGDDHP